MKRYRVKSGTRVDLDDWDADDHSAFDFNKQDANTRTEALRARLEELQEMLYAEHKHKVLIVLQAMDTGGKDGTIRHVFDGVNPQGVKVKSFKAPTRDELDHDYLWRVHPHVPGKGDMVIFNRSHYEDVLVVRVHQWVPKDEWQQRYAQINDFERLLVEEGTSILKFYLHIDRAEQKRRLQARLDDPTKHWKFNEEDLLERKLWDDYMRAYGDALSQTSSDCAPWHIVPANHKWYRNLIVSRIVHETLRKMDPQFPPAPKDLAKLVVE